MDTNKPEHYFQNHEIQKIFTQRIWKIFATRMKKEGFMNSVKNVIDFGCGTGDTTMKLAQWINDFREPSDR